jgi:hypothetical protein
MIKREREFFCRYMFLQTALTAEGNKTVGQIVIERQIQDIEQKLEDQRLPKQKDRIHSHGYLAEGNGSASR